MRWIKYFLIILFLFSFYSCIVPKRIIKVLYNNDYTIQNGYCLEFYEESGKVKAIVPYRIGSKNGKAYWFYESGDIMSVGKYKNGKREGYWKTYNSHGVLTQKIKFEADSAITIRSYNPAQW